MIDRGRAERRARGRRERQEMYMVVWEEWLHLLFCMFQLLGALSPHETLILPTASRNWNAPLRFE
jgi:hypothetical protein